MHEDELPKDFNFDRDFPVFFQASGRAFKTAYNRIKNQMAKERMDEDTAQVELVTALIKAPEVDDHFMTNSLRAMTVDELKVFTGINQNIFRHLVAWMTYKLWYLGLEQDMTGMPNRYKGLAKQDFMAKASADANNTAEVWEKRYAPAGMSSMTQAEEEQMVPADLSDDEEVDFAVFDADDGVSGAAGAGAGAGAGAALAAAAGAGAGAGSGGAGAGKRQRTWKSDDDTEEDDQDCSGKKRKKGKKRARARACAGAGKRQKACGAGGGAGAEGKKHKKHKKHKKDKKDKKGKKRAKN